jgi:small conductance mechanosensitive channel
MSWEEIKNFIEFNSKIIIGIGVTIILTLISLFILKAITLRSIKKARNNRAITLAKLVQSILRYSIVIVATIIIIGLTGYDITAILAGAGILGIVIGLGAQSLIADLLSGLAIVFENYCEIDETVEINGFKGKVIEIGLRSTKIQNWKGELKIITNGEIKELTNFSRTFSIATVEFTVNYGEDISKIISLLEENLQNMKEFYPQIVEGPNVLGVSNIGMNGYNITLTAKTLCEQHFAVERGLRRRVIELFNEHNIKFSLAKIEVMNY